MIIGDDSQPVINPKTEAQKRRAFYAPGKGVAALETRVTAIEADYVFASSVFATDDVLLASDGTDRGAKATAIDKDDVVTAASNYAAANRLVLAAGADKTTQGSSVTESDVTTALTDIASLQTDEVAAVYVSKAGNDSDDGLIPSDAKLTIGSAITAASSLISGGATKVSVVISDGGSYTEDITLPDNVDLLGPAATLVGALTMGAGCRAQVHAHYAASSFSTMLTLSSGTGESRSYWAHIMDGRGTGGSLTGCLLVAHATAGEVIFVHVGQMFVPENGYGLIGSGAGVSHTHFYISDLYLAGDGAKGLLGVTSTTNLVGWIDHILEVGSPSSTDAINMTTAGAVIKLTCSEIIADEVYNISGGDLYLTCPKITGTRTGTPVIEISDTLVGIQSIQGVAASEVVVNESGADVNLRVKGATATDLLVVDAGADMVDIGTTTQGDIATFRPAGVILNPNANDQDFIVRGSTATLLFVLDAGGNRVDFGTTTQGDLATFRDQQITFNINRNDINFLVRGDNVTNLFLCEAGLDAVQIGTNTAGAIADFRSSSIVFNQLGADLDTRFEGDTLPYMFFCDASAATENIALVTASAPNWQSMDRGLFIGDASTAPTGNPSAGVFAYSSSGDLVARNTQGAVSTLSGITRGAAASVADGGTVTHGLGTTPTGVVATGSVAGEIITVTALGATTFTVAVKAADGTTSGTSQTIYWQAFK